MLWCPRMARLRSLSPNLAAHTNVVVFRLCEVIFSPFTFRKSVNRSDASAVDTDLFEKSPLAHGALHIGPKGRCIKLNPKLSKTSFHARPHGKGPKPLIGATNGIHIVFFSSVVEVLVIRVRVSTNPNFSLPTSATSHRMQSTFAMSDHLARL